MSEGFPGGSEVKNLPANVGDSGSIPGSGRSPGEGIGNLLQGSCLENPMERGAWRAKSMGLKRVRHSLETNNNNEWKKSDKKNTQHKKCTF